MPVISRFYGIDIVMHLPRKEHNPPHIHAFYGDYQATFRISDGELFYGKMPANAKRLVKEFVLLYQKELFYMWETEQFEKLPPIE